MAKLIRILAASFGGGLVLGAGIRLGEALASRESGGTGTRGPGGRPDDPEARIKRGTEERAAAVAAIQTRLTAEARRIEGLAEQGARLHRELPEWIERSVARRLAEVEAELKAESARSRKESLDALVDGVQARVAQRISRLEEEVSLHSAAMTELHACSLRTESSIGKLAGSIDRLLAAQPAFPAPASDAPPPRVAQPEPVAAAAPPARSRWKIFG